MPEKKAELKIYLPLELKKAIKIKAVEHDLPVTTVVEAAIKEFLGIK